MADNLPEETSMRTFYRAFLALLLIGCALQLNAAIAADQPIQVVYHLTGGIDEAARAMGNVRNHLKADPSAKIIVVGNGAGIDFMLDGAKDANGNPFDATIQDLESQGVAFRVCNNTLVARGIDKSRVVSEAKIVPSGVAEVARLQAREGHVYLRP